MGGTSLKQRIYAIQESLSLEDFGRQRCFPQPSIIRDACDISLLPPDIDNDPLCSTLEISVQKRNSFGSNFIHRTYERIRDCFAYIF